MVSSILDAIYSIILVLSQGVLILVKFLNDMFEILAGVTQVKYNGSNKYLIEVFFTQSVISNAYWGMALIGIVLCFAFAIIAVIRKMFDSGDKIRTTLGQILGSTFKGILMILCTTMMVLGVVRITNVIIQRIDVLFSNSSILSETGGAEHKTTGEELAAMARIFNTIGNYSLNQSYNSRYNINSCYNAIRPDLEYLKESGTFDVVYDSKDEDGNKVETWQSTLQEIVNSAQDLTQDMDVDIYDEKLSEAVLNAMENIRTNTSLRPVESYKNEYGEKLKDLSMDTCIFLMATYNAAKNKDYNVNPLMTDAVRGPYYTGQKSIYDSPSSIGKDFELGDISYMIIFVVGFKVLYDLAVCIFNCGARIFNLLILYMISPPIFAALPLDDGAKAKQWSIAFIVQSFGVFASIIGMKLLLLFIPIVMSDKLVLVQDGTVINVVGKVVILMVAMEAVKKSSGMVTGILSDSAGLQSVTAGDMSDLATGALDTYTPLGTAKQKLGELRETVLGRGKGGSSGGGGSRGSGGGGSKGSGGGGKTDSARNQGEEKDAGADKENSADSTSGDDASGKNDGGNIEKDTDSARNQGGEKDEGPDRGKPPEGPKAKPKYSLSEFIRNAKPKGNVNNQQNPENARNMNNQQNPENARNMNEQANPENAEKANEQPNPENVRNENNEQNPVGAGNAPAKPKVSLTEFINNAKPKGNVNNVQNPVGAENVQAKPGNDSNNGGLRMPPPPSNERK